MPLQNKDAVGCILRKRTFSALAMRYSTAASCFTVELEQKAGVFKKSYRSSGIKHQEGISTR
jgi:hypothetical protein